MAGCHCTLDLHYQRDNPRPQPRTLQCEIGQCLDVARLDYATVVLEIIDKDRDGLGPFFGGKPEARKYLCQVSSHLLLINSGNSLNWDYLEQSPEV